MTEKSNLCAIFNYAPHYRFSIFKEMEKEFSCDFYFGDEVNTDIKKIDYNKLKGYKKELSNYTKNKIQLRKGVWKLAFKKQYKNYLITWEPLNLSLWLFLILCKVLGKNVYSWQHGVSRKKVTKKFLFLDIFFLKFKKGTFLYGHTAKENMIRLGFNPDKLFVIYNSLDYIKNLEFRNIERDHVLYKKHFQNSDPVLLFIGRLTSIKKLDMILRAQYNLLKKNIKCNLIFIGDGEMKDDLKELATNLNIINRCWFTGALYDEKEISNYLHSADICISPGNVGLTAIHSLSYGLPVITNDNFETQMPEFEAIKQGVTGSFFRENNEKSLTFEIENWLTYSLNNRQLIREDCYKVIDEKYNPINQIKILNKHIYKK
jgi:glycosyltransferase involved in cell wall biosynthesis